MAESAIPQASSDPALSSRRIWLIAGLVFIVLFAAYWFFIRATYEPVLTDVAPEDAAEIVKVLEAQKLPYRFADNGRTILVPAGEVDKARIELIRSELPMRGQVGFELFNQSDMGLTEFAQKINYQRALQGELARTILLLKGIQSVRVHLGLPERSVFRDEQAQPKASITIILKPGQSLTEGTVSGIQRMIASAIPEMRSEAVSVLDGSGRLISAETTLTAPLTGSDALLENYRQQIAAAIGRSHPGLRYDMIVSLRYITPPAIAAAEPGAGSLPKLQAPPRGNPDFAVNVRMTTAARLDESLRLELLREVRQAIDFDSRRGDAILFLVGEVSPTNRPSLPQLASDKVVTKANALPADSANGIWHDYWVLFAIAAIALAAAAWFRDRRRRSSRRSQELTSFADRLRERLQIATGDVR